MKRGTPDHPKTRRLARLLGIHVAQAAGHLEFFWHWTAKYAPLGDVGRFEDGDIEEGSVWPGEPGAFVRALIAVHYLDESEAHRLLVHDWSDHADTAVHRQLARACQRFADGTAPKLYNLTKIERAKAEAAFGALVDEEHEATARPSGDNHAAIQRPSDGAPPRPAVPRPAPPDTTDPPSPPPADAAGGPTSLEARRDAVVAYWISLGGHPSRERRREILEFLKRGYTVEQLRGSVAERVRSTLILEGKLKEADEWPPGHAPPEGGPVLGAGHPAPL